MLLSQDMFSGLFDRFENAFRFETRDAYPLGPGREDFDLFLAGTPSPPTECEWLKPWLTKLSDWTRDGRTISRVRVLAEPPTDYQRWLLWGHPWMARAGEDTQYMTRTTAQQAGLPLGHDWWLFDGTHVVEMWFSDQNETTGMRYVDERQAVANYRRWRDVALQHAVTAQRVAAA
jgi:hypothetical protein